MSVKTRVRTESLGALPHVYCMNEHLHHAAGIFGDVQWNAPAGFHRQGPGTLCLCAKAQCKAVQGSVANSDNFVELTNFLNSLNVLLFSCRDFKVASPPDRGQRTRDPWDPLHLLQCPSWPDPEDVAEPTGIAFPGDTCALPGAQNGLEPGMTQESSPLLQPDCT